MNNDIKKNIEESIQLKTKLLSKDFLKKLTLIADLMVKTIISDKKIIFCGNGGSAADAQHLAAELLIRLKTKNNRSAIPAFSLAQDTSTITACGNDFGFEFLFERNLMALGQKGDMLICLSTSGNSKNIIKASDYARKNKIKVIGFLGSDGGELKNKCDHSIIIPSFNTARIQEVHITIGHALMEYLEDRLYEVKFISKLN